MGKEIERPLNTPEAVAVQEVESYIEKVEKSTENSAQDSSANKQNANPSTDDVGIKTPPSGSLPVDHVAKKKIVLPLTEQTINDGLKDDVASGFKWLSEWCVMMIKKYPGRVFYSPPTGKYD